MPREFNIRTGITPEQFFTHSFLEAKLSLTMSCCSLVKAHLPQKKSSYQKKPKQEHGVHQREYTDQKKLSSDYEEEEEVRAKPQLVSLPRVIHDTEDTDDGFQLNYQANQPQEYLHSQTLGPGGGLQYPSEMSRLIPHFASKEGSREEVRNFPISSSSLKPTQSTEDKDAIIASQRQFIQELKGLILATNDNLRTLTERFAHFGNEISSKIEGIEARVKLLEAVVVIKRASVFNREEED